MAFISDDLFESRANGASAYTMDLFKVAKRSFDIVAALILLLFAAVIGIVLFFLNPFWNAGPLFYVQKRMGKDCKPFTVFKFRSMTTGAERSADGRLETNRITPLGNFLRACRIDELPQAINILRGEMSLVGPRPDFLPHAMEYLATVPGYKNRYSVRPGITGLAQVSLGYIDTVEGVHEKVEADRFYIKNMSFINELIILSKTFRVVLSGQGK